jgi:hypothetical protein
VKLTALWWIVSIRVVFATILCVACVSGLLRSPQDLVPLILQPPNISMNERTVALFLFWYGDCVITRYQERRAIMHDVTLWAAWYLLLLAIPALLIGSFIREKVAHRRSVRRRSIR